MVLGKEIRLNRILKKGKMLCIPLDHGISSGPLEGIQNISELIYQTQDSGLTCFLVNKGIIKSLQSPPSIGLIAHMSAATSLGPDSNNKILVATVASVVSAGRSPNVRSSIAASVSRASTPVRPSRTLSGRACGRVSA